MRFNNIVVFPGTTERLIEQGHRHAEAYQYDLAVQCLEEALQYTDGDEAMLSVYAYALYETRAFEKAKTVCEDLLAIGPAFYFEIMELYLTICMQLKDFEQARELIEALLEEELIPPEQIEKFERLRNLNNEIAENSQSHEEVEVKEIDFEVYELDGFKEKTLQHQIILLHELAGTNIRQVQHLLKTIIEDAKMHPFIQSLALILLAEQEVNIDVTISKFGEVITVNTSELKLPTDLPQFQIVQSIVREKLAQEPTTLEMVEHLLAKHTIVSYPFEWLSYDSEDVALSYIDYVQEMFGQVKEMDYEIIGFLQMLDKFSEFQQI